jgi:hypothetical protein
MQQDGIQWKGWQKARERTLIPGWEAISRRMDYIYTLLNNPWVSLRIDQLITF